MSFDNARLFKEMNKSPEKFVFRKLAFLITLWLISKKQRTGYELIKEFEKDRMLAIALPSRIYPLLGNMGKFGLVEKKSKMQGKRKAYSYSITKKGKEVLKYASKCVSNGIKGQFFKEMVK
ncbi:PadR family transcriptional regulator [Candidatus Micrarchaeota archaeon]|nr:PadR family transcriptional regulator [Candidatus Micrarchaeota archaeon]